MTPRSPRSTTANRNSSSPDQSQSTLPMVSESSVSRVRWCRDFLVTLRALDDLLRIEVADTRGDRRPPLTRQPPAPDAESGRGLPPIEAVADRWGVAEGPVPRKTVRAELDLVPPEHENACAGVPCDNPKGTTDGEKEPSQAPPAPVVDRRGHSLTKVNIANSAGQSPR